MAARLRILAVGTRMPAWVQAGFAEYHKRMPRDFAVELREIPVSRREGARAVAEEGEALLAALGADEHVVALEVGGEPWSTADLAARLRAWRDEGRRAAFLIGGPDGLAGRVPRARGEPVVALEAHAATPAGAHRADGADLPRVEHPRRPSLPPLSARWPSDSRSRTPSPKRASSASAW